jgi:aerobic carbon-monoxide dehydrogenase small subunit
MTATHSYTLTINGNRHNITEAWILESLLDVLRDRCGLPGAKNACTQGECGSCSVLLDGDLVCSCLVLAASAEGAQITTVEGIGGSTLPGATAQLSDVQQAFVTEGAVQCGFCTPGLIMAVHDLLDRVPSPTDLDVREAISGNLCRCTGYGRILEAVRHAVTERAGVPR